MKNLFSIFSEWKTSAIVFKKRYFIGGIDLFLFADFLLTSQSAF